MFRPLSPECNHAVQGVTLSASAKHPAAGSLATNLFSLLNNGYGVWVAICVAIAAILAGCAGPSAAPELDPEVRSIVESRDLKVTPTTGLLLGLVVDERIVPIQGANVSLGSGEEATTSVDGTFGFDGLQPGEHLVTVHKPGFLDQTLSAAVIAGQRDPPLISFQLTVSLTYVDPFIVAVKVEGYIECTTNPVAVCSLPNNYRPTACGVHPLLCYGNVTADNARFGLEFPGNTSFLQGELFWQASTRFSEQLGFKAEPGQGCDGVGGTNQLAYGPSPLIAPGIAPELRIPGGGACSVIVLVSGGTLVEDACVPGLPLFGTLCPGVVVQQRFSAFVHAFYGFLPLEGWRFSVDGEPVVP